MFDGDFSDVRDTFKADDLISSAVEEATREYMSERDSFMRETLESNDWDIFPILDFVWVSDLGTPGFDAKDISTVSIGERVVVRRYGPKAPPVEESAIEGKRCEIQRVTKPLWDKVQDEYELA